MNPTPVRDDSMAHDAFTALLDREAVASLLYRAHASIDEGRFEDLRTIFTDDATASTPGGIAEGIDALVDQAARNHTRTAGVQHFMTGLIVEVEGDRASMRSNLLVVFADGDPVATPRFELGEIYRTEAVRTPDGWRLCGVESHPVWQRGQRSWGERGH